MSTILFLLIITSVFLASREKDSLLLNVPCLNFKFNFILNKSKHYCCIFTSLIFVVVIVLYMHDVSTINHEHHKLWMRRAWLCINNYPDLINRHLVKMILWVFWIKGKNITFYNLKKKKKIRGFSNAMIFCNYPLYRTHFTFPSQNQFPVYR